MVEEVAREVLRKGALRALAEDEGARARASLGLPAAAARRTRRKATTRLRLGFAPQKLGGARQVRWRGVVQAVTGVGTFNLTRWEVGERGGHLEKETGEEEEESSIYVLAPPPSSKRHNLFRFCSPPHAQNTPQLHPHTHPLATLAQSQTPCVREPKRFEEEEREKLFPSHALLENAHPAFPLPPRPQSRVQVGASDLRPPSSWPGARHRRRTPARGGALPRGEASLSFSRRRALTQRLVAAPPLLPTHPTAAMAMAGVQLPLADVRSAQGSDIPLKTVR